LAEELGLVSGVPAINLAGDPGPVAGQAAPEPVAAAAVRAEVLLGLLAEGEARVSPANLREPSARNLKCARLLASVESRYRVEMEAL